MKGFSLLELLICISILSIIAAFTTPSFNNLLTKTQEELASAQLLRAIALAKSTAQLQNNPIILTKSLTTWEQGQILKSNNKTLARFDPMPNATLHWRSSLNRDYLQIEPNNIINIEDGTFWYCRKGTHNPAWAIRINPNARARLQLPDKHGNITGLAC